MTERYFSDTDGLGLGRPDHEPLASEAIEGIVELVGALIERGHAYASGGDISLRWLLPRLRQAVEPAAGGMRQGDSLERPGLKEDPGSFALWKAHKPGEEHGLGHALGAGTAGMAHRVLGHGRRLGVPPSTSTAAEATSFFPTTRMRSPRRRRWRAGGRLFVTGSTREWCKWKRRRCPSRSATPLLHEALERVGRDALVMYFVQGHSRQPLAFIGGRSAGSPALGGAPA